MLVLPYFLLVLIADGSLSTAIYSTVRFYGLAGMLIFLVMFGCALIVRRRRSGPVIVELRLVGSTLSFTRGSGSPSTALPVDSIESWQRWSRYFAIVLPRSVLLVPLDAFGAGALERLEDLLRR